MKPTPKRAFDLESALSRLLDDPPGTEKVARTIARGKIEALPEMLAPYGLYPIPREICIPVIKVINGMHPVGYHMETECFRYFTPPPHAPNALSLLLTESDIQQLKTTFLPTLAGSTPISLWDLLVKRGQIVCRIKFVADFVIINETRQTEICKVMHGNPIASTPQ